MRKINEDIQILQDNFEIYKPMKSKCRIIILVCLSLMIYVSWKLSLVLFGGVIFITIYSKITERTLNKRNSLVK